MRKIGQDKQTYKNREQRIIKVLFLTTEWPTEERPTDVPFLVQYAQALRRQDVDVEIYHFRGQGNPLNYIRAWLHIRQQPSWDAAELIHAHWGQSAFLTFLSRKPLVITFHGSDLQGIMSSLGEYSLKGKILVWVNRLVARRADVCIAVSRRLQQLLPQSRNPHALIPMGINLETFKPMDKTACRRTLNLDPEKRYLLFVCDPNRPEKRFSLAQQAVACAGLDNTELLVVSDQPYVKIPTYLNAGDLLLLTSSHEGSPVILKEALACNLPVVSVDVGDAREKLENITGCVVCENDDVETIALGIREALDYDQPIKGRDSVLDLSWDMIAQKTVEIYKQCLAEEPD